MIGDQDATLRDARDVTIPHLNDVRGHLTLPAKGPHGSALRWGSSAPDVIAPDGTVLRPAPGSDPVHVTLAVHASAGSSTTQYSHHATVRPLPEQRPLEAYLMPHFVGEYTPDGEAIYFALSKGNTIAAWDTLNGGRPVLVSQMGERGLRDPFIVRSPEGDRFFLLATDCKIYGGNDFFRAQERGSRALMIWESTDLVNWGEQRMVEVSSEHAGNTWAPEATWSPELGQYIVYWASNLYPTADRTTWKNADSYNRMMYAMTRDFVTFDEPQVWIDVQRAPGYGTIDSAVIRHEGMYYRFTKDERPDVMKVFQERSPDILRPTTGAIGSSWDLLATEIGGEVLDHGEGPIIFKSNTEDRWYLFLDWPPYGGGHGYLSFETTDLNSGVWTPTSEAPLPTGLRHGSVLPITREEHDRLSGAYLSGISAVHENGLSR